MFSFKLETKRGTLTGRAYQPWGPENEWAIDLRNNRRTVLTGIDEDARFMTLNSAIEHLTKRACQWKAYHDREHDKEPA